MQNFASLDAPVVALSQSQEHLHENFPNHVLGHEILVRLALLDQLGHVAVLAELHHNEDLLFLAQVDALHVTHDVGVIQLAQAIDFADDLTALFFGQMTVFDFFPTIEFLRSVLVLLLLFFIVFGCVERALRAHRVLLQLVYAVV